MKKPNLFSYATSELSQDAFICWLLAWADPKYLQVDAKLHRCAESLLVAFFNKHGKSIPEKIQKVQVFKQYKRIDILCILNDRYPIIIEDKTGTQNHSNQLERYVCEIQGINSFDQDDFLPIYFKTHDQCSYEDVESKGYKPFLRSDFLEILKCYDGTNEILLDYLQYLQHLDDSIQSFRTRKLDDWDWYSWIGFYHELKLLLGDGEWRYVSNPTGGFLGFWWHVRGDDKCEQYLLLEQGKLCFKINVADKGQRGTLRWSWHKKLVDQCNSFGLQLIKPQRFGSGANMTVCVLAEDYRIPNDGPVDLDATLELLRKAEKLLEQVTQ